MRGRRGRRTCARPASRGPPRPRRPARARPRNWMRASYWSLQKNGTAWYGVPSPPAGRGEQVAGGGGALLGGVGPVLDAHLLAEQLVGPAGDVAGGVHARAARRRGWRRTPRRRAARGRCRPASRWPGRRRCRPPPRRRRRTVPSLSRTPLDPVGRPRWRRRRRRGARRRRGRGAGRRRPRPSRAPRPRTSGAAQGLEHVTSQALAARRGGHLDADEPGADHDHPAGLGVEGGPQGERVVERAQHVDAVERRAGRADGRGAAPVAMIRPS